MPELDPKDPVLTLWKTDDKAWMKQRRLEWENILQAAFKNSSKREIADNKRFFLKGDKRELVGTWALYLFTPFTDANEAKLAFFSSLFSRGGREDILSVFIHGGMLWGERVLWIRRSMKAFVEGVLGSEYKEPHCIDFDGRKVRACGRDWFCNNSVRYTLNVLTGKLDYHGYLESFDYFLSVMKHISQPKDISRLPIPDLIKASEDYLAADHPNEDALGFARKVVEHKSEMLAIYESWRTSL